MKNILKHALLIIVLSSCIKKERPNNRLNEYTGIEYRKLQKELVQGWNTWNSTSVLEHVLMPQAISVSLQFEDVKSNSKLLEGLIGRPGASVENITPIAKTTNGEYSELDLKWHQIEVKIQTTAVGEDLLILLTPLSKFSGTVLSIKPKMSFWEEYRDFSVELIEGDLSMVVPSGKYAIHVSGAQSTVAEGSVAVESFANPVALSVSKNKLFTFDEIVEEINLAKATYNESLNAYGELKDTYNAIKNVINWNLVYEPRKMRAYTPVSRMFGGGWSLFCWDTYFAAYMSIIVDKRISYSNVIAVTEDITADGFVPNTNYVQMGFISEDRSQPPVGSLMVWEIYKKEKERWFLHEVYDKLLAWNRWWPKNRDNNGLLCYGSDPYEPPVRQLDLMAVGKRLGGALESGLDNSPMYDAVDYDAETHLLDLKDVGLTSLYIADCNALAKISDELGYFTARDELLERAKYYKDNMKEMWDEERKCYFNLRSEDHILDTNNISPTSFYPLLAEVPTQKMAGEMIENFYFNANEFYGAYLLPSISRDNLAFGDNNYWRGRIWAPMNFLVYLGLSNYDLPEARKDLATKSNELFLKSWNEYGHIYENYNSETGEGMDVINSDRFHHWSALLGFVELIEKGYVTKSKE